MRKNLMRINVLLFAALFCLNCSLVTDFDPDLLVDEDAGALYSLSDNIIDPVEVTLYDDETASIVLELEEVLPDEDDETLLSMIDTGIISLEVVNVDTRVSINLTEGTRVDDGTDPSEPGQYALSLNGARDEIHVVFWNETTGGQGLQAGGNYRAIVNVAPNSIFVSESIIRNVDVFEFTSVSSLRNANMLPSQ